jgi:hypothetical protein
VAGGTLAGVTGALLAFGIAGGVLDVAMNVQGPGWSRPAAAR